MFNLTEINLSNYHVPLFRNAKLQGKNNEQPGVLCLFPWRVRCEYLFCMSWRVRCEYMRLDQNAISL